MNPCAPFHCGLLLLASMSLQAESQVPTIPQDVAWKDAAGDEIQAQGGCILKHGDTFHWYGVAFTGTTPSQVRCYGSKDLATWTFGKVVLDQHVSRRIKVLYYPTAKRFVLFTRDGVKLGISTASEPVGPFTWMGESPLAGVTGPGDENPLLDDDGKAYVVYPAGAGADGNDRIICAGLDAEWIAATKVVQTFPEAQLGSPALWKRGAIYCCTASEANGWRSSGLHFSTAPAPGGPWTAWKMMDRSTCNTQHNTVFRIDGAKGRCSSIWATAGASSPTTASASRCSCRWNSGTTPP